MFITAVCIVFLIKLRWPSNKNLYNTELPSLQNRRLQGICVLMYKVKNDLCPPYINDIFINHRSKYNLRQTDFSTARHNTTTQGKHSLRYLWPKLRGKLPSDLKEVNTLKCFKNKIRSLDITMLIDNGCKNCHVCNSQIFSFKFVNTIIL